MFWMTMPLKRYFDFQGRSRRREFWMFALGYILVVLALLTFGFVLGDSGYVVLFAIGMLGLALIIPTLAVQVRRLHDQNFSGWWLLGYYLISWIPLLGLMAAIAMLVMFCLPGTRGPNRFGPDPKENLADTFA